MAAILTCTLTRTMGRIVPGVESLRYRRLVETKAWPLPGLSS